MDKTRIRDESVQKGSRANIQGAVAIIIYHKKILLLLRDNNPDIPSPNAWQLPGGQTEEGEDHLQTMQRELLEEISMIPHDLTPLGKTPDSIWVYMALLEDKEAAHIKLGSEGQELRFFLPEELNNLLLSRRMKLYMDNYQNGLKTLIKNGTYDNISLLGLTR